MVSNKYVAANEYIVPDFDAVDNSDVYIEIDRHVVADDELWVMILLFQTFYAQSRSGAEVIAQTDIFCSYDIEWTFNIAAHMGGGAVGKSVRSDEVERSLDASVWSYGAYP